MSNWIGQSVSRIEDERLLKGKGRYLADVKIPGTLEAVFVRSTRSELGATGSDPIEPMVQRALAHGWEVREISATHDPHLSNPDAVVALLRELAG